MNETLGNVNFEIIRYANCWEDAGVLLHAIEGRDPQKIAIISSAGDNALALLSTFPRAVLAFDISWPQLYLTELKQVAIDRLEYIELLLLLGVTSANATERLQLYNHLEAFLSDSAKKYWRANRALIEKGLIHAGKFEHYFNLFRRHCLPFVHSRKTVEKLLSPKSDIDQKEFYRKHWNNLRWQLLMNIFFSRPVMGRAGRDPQFLKQVRLSVSQYIRQKAATHLQSSEATQNHLLHYIFTGSFDAVLPHYLRPEYYEAIRANIGRLTIRQANADDVVSEAAHDVYCLSNIFEYYPQETFTSTVVSWAGMMPAGAQLLFWNLMVPRSFSQTAPDMFKQIEPISYVPDAGFFYSAFLNEQKL